MKPRKTWTIDVKEGIYDTSILVKIYKNIITVRRPYIRWKNNNGNLDFILITIKYPEHIKNIIQFEKDDDYENMFDFLKNNYRF